MIVGNNNNKNNNKNNSDTVQEFTENLIGIRRLAKVLKGGRRFSFSALVIVGNKKGKVGYGFGKASDVSEAIRKAVNSAQKSLVKVPMYKSTIPHWVEGKFSKSKIIFRPASPGTGIIAGGPVRIVLEMAGYHDILAKSLGSRNSINMVKATFQAFDQLLLAKEAAKTRGKALKEFWS